MARKSNAKQNLPWLNSNLWDLMKKIKKEIKTFLKSRLTTDHLKYKDLRNKVMMQLRKAKADFFLEFF